MNSTDRENDAVSRLEDYALIGDGHSAALVGRDGSIDWLCWPRFDSDTCFAALLGEPTNGRWRIAPVEPAVDVRRDYQPGTAVLRTVVETGQGVLEQTDLMPWPEDENHSVIRRLACTKGRVTVRSEMLARHDYGRVSPWCRRRDESWQLVMGPIALWLAGSAEHELTPDGTLVCERVLEAGDTLDFVLQCEPSWRDTPNSIDAEKAEAATLQFWDDWSSRHGFKGHYSGQALRSLITLKILTDRHTGGVVAAPTSSLPEQLGGPRNWDYRYGWLRDASFTLTAFAASGFGDDAASWRDWVVRSVSGDPSQLQIMYAIDGRRRLDEWECDWLCGYEGATPVRFGNGAAGQQQIDVFGEVINALYQSRQHGLHPDRQIWEVERGLVDYLAKIWRQPGHGIWEMRGSPRIFTLSRVMAWVCVDRALRSASEFDLPAPTREWKALADEIHEDVLAHGFNAERGAFTQVYGETDMDASLLMLAIYGFLPPDDERIVATVQAIEQDLDEDGYLRRYRTSGHSDGLPGSEGSFLACSFWLAHVKVLQGKKREAEVLIDRLLSCSNDLGLLSEEYDTSAKRLCGNFPQALSHVALINTVLAFDREK